MRKCLFSWVLVAMTASGAASETTARADGNDAPSTWMLQPNPYDPSAPDPNATPVTTAPTAPPAAATPTSSPSVGIMQNTPISTAPVETGTAKVSFAVRTEAGTDISHARVLMDGQVLTDALQGWAVSIPAGDHVFEFDGPGYVAQDHSLVIHAGSGPNLVTVTLGSADAAASRFSEKTEPWNARTVIFQPRTASHLQPASPTESATKSDPWLVTYVTGGTAIAALGIGTVLGITASNQISELKQSCAPNCSSAQVDRK